jgi:hypothetical protein
MTDFPLLARAPSRSNVGDLLFCRLFARDLGAEQRRRAANVPALEARIPSIEATRWVNALTPERETIARFWSDDPGATATPPATRSRSRRRSFAAKERASPLPPRRTQRSGSPSAMRSSRAGTRSSSTTCCARSGICGDSTPTGSRFSSPRRSPSIPRDIRRSRAPPARCCGYDRLAPGTACVEGVWSLWCLYRQTAPRQSQ